jgi:adenosine deaminase
MKLSTAALKSLPKVLLHEHLDGVLRPPTIIDLAREVNYGELPTQDPAHLAAWFHHGANQGSLAKYLEGFAHTIAVMQTEEALERVAYEQAEDLSRDGDLAGEEGGYPPKKHVDAFHYIQRENFNITIHAGEGFGKESIWQAIQYCGAHRIGHGTRLIDDIALAEGKPVKFGDLAQYVLDKRIPLEVCLISNIHTGAAKSLAEHPFKILYQAKFRVTLNTDNRLMSDTSMSKEFAAAADTFSLGLDDFEKLTINAMKSAFLPYEQRIDFIYSAIKPGYAKIRSSLAATTAGKN